MNAKAAIEHNIPLLERLCKNIVLTGGIIQQRSKNHYLNEIVLFYNDFGLQTICLYYSGDEISNDNQLLDLLYNISNIKYFIKIDELFLTKRQYSKVYNIENHPQDRIHAVQNRFIFMVSKHTYSSAEL